MAKIRILPEHLTNKIAAGEVVQRPASLVKELVENSLDAGATDIVVVIKNGGKSLCEVSDNGEGMSKDDLLLAFERYATSKIATVEDLINIRTLGFRGEALASIAAVAMVTAHSTLRGADTGYQLHIEGGTFREIKPCPPQEGTLIAVRNLFYNIPARRKFLKSAEVEYRHIVEIIQKFALAHNQVSFKLIHNDREIYNLRAESQTDRIANLFNDEYAANLVPIEWQAGELKVTGYLGNLNLVRARGGEQFLFVNQRFVTDRLMNHAIITGYGSLLSRNEYPFYCLNLALPPDAVDVNVHPTKMEVKFRNQDEVYQFLHQGVTRALQASDHVMPNLGRFAPAHYYSPPDLPKGRTTAWPSESSSGVKKPPAVQTDALPAGNQSSLSFAPPVEKEKWQERARRFAEQTKTITDSDDFQPVIRVFQVHNKYIVSQVKSGLVIIDQHVAHERILFEEALEAMSQGNWRAQQLLFPVVLEMTPTDFSTLLQILPFLEKLGFRLKEFGKNTVLVEAVPAGIRWGNEQSILKEILDHYQEYGTKDTSIQERVAAAYACKAAVKSGDALQPEEMQNLVDHLFATKNPYFCPHGRPIIVNLSLKELDKRFERA